MLERARQEWFSNIRGDLLSGIVVALALIPEAIAFSIIAGVDPKVGLYASFCIAVVIAFVGGRPGMISAATGAMALLMVTLVKEHGLQYLLAATLLTGLFQIAAGYLRLGSLMRFVSRSVVTGFVNAGIPAHVSGGGGAEPMRLDGIDRHFLVVDVDPAAEVVTGVGVVRVDP